MLVIKDDCYQTCNRNIQIDRKSTLMKIGQNRISKYDGSFEKMNAKCEDAQVVVTSMTLPLQQLLMLRDNV